MSPLDKLGVAISDAGITWTNEMRSAWDAAKNAELAHDLTEPVELSDEPSSILFASPGMWGGKGDAVTIRRKKFALRKDYAHILAKTIEAKLMELFGAQDETDGYRKDQL